MKTWLLYAGVSTAVALYFLASYALQSFLPRILVELIGGTADGWGMAAFLGSVCGPLGGAIAVGIYKGNL